MSRVGRGPAEPQEDVRAAGDAEGAGPGGHQDEPVDAVGLGPGQLLRHGAAEADPEDVGALDADARRGRLPRSAASRWTL